MSTATPGPRVGTPARGVRVARWIGRWGLIILITGSLCMLAARTWWVFELACELRWQVGIASSCIALVLLAGRLRTWALAATVLALVHLAPAIELSFGGDHEAAAGAHVTVASVNLWHTNRRIDLVRRWLEADRPDVVACFEVSAYWARELEGLSSEYPCRRIVRSTELDPDAPVASERLDGDALERTARFPARWGVALLSRVPLEDVVVHTVPGSPDPYLEARATIEGVRFHFVVLHPERPGREPRTKRRDALLRDTAATTHWTDTSIVLGDLNATLYAPIFREFVERARLTDARRGFGRQPTWNPGYGFPGPWLDLDHVLVRSGIVVEDCRVGPEIGSDHRPVIARLRAR